MNLFSFSTFKIFIFFGILTAGFFLFHSVDYDFSRLIKMTEGTDPFTFLILMSSLPLLGLPISGFYLFSGATFPWLQAWGLCSLALAINISIAYPIGKFFLATPLSHLLEKHKKSLPSLSTQSQFKICFLVRSIPGIPYFLQNYLLALIEVRFLQYFIISWSIQSVFAAGMTAIPKLLFKTGWIWASIIICLLLLLALFRRVYTRSVDNRNKSSFNPNKTHVE